MSHKRTNLSKSSYAAAADFARDLHAGGGPSMTDLGLITGAGEYSELLRATWGSSREEFAKACEYEAEREQRLRPHIFLRKWGR
jgi:hypothetical protein